MGIWQSAEVIPHAEKINRIIIWLVRIHNIQVNNARKTDFEVAKDPGSSLYHAMTFVCSVPYHMHRKAVDGSCHLARAREEWSTIKEEMSGLMKYHADLKDTIWSSNQYCSEGQIDCSMSLPWGLRDCQWALLQHSPLVDGKATERALWLVVEKGSNMDWGSPSGCWWLQTSQETWMHTKLSKNHCYSNVHSPSCIFGGIKSCLPSNTSSPNRLIDCDTVCGTKNPGMCWPCWPLAMASPCCSSWFLCIANSWQDICLLPWPP